MYVERDFKEKFESANSNHSIVAVVGPRQAGKTTFLKKKIEGKNASYMLFDDPDAKELFEEDIKKFDNQYIKGYDLAVLDEIQYCKDAGQKMKYLADIGRKLWVTSSSETILQKEVLSYLVGRVSVIQLYPFNFNEFLRAKNQIELTDNIRERMVWEHAVYGGYPQVVKTENNEMKKQVLHSLHRTMLLKDVAHTFSIDQVDKLEKLTKYLSHLIGDTVKYQSISKDLDFTFKTLKKYITALEQSYILKRVKPFHTNKKKELVKRPKLYFLDPGLRNKVAGEFPDKVPGELFENYVYTELLKQGYNPKYWRTKNQAEVDFILKDGEHPIEVKKTDPGKIPSGLRTFIQKYSPETAYVALMKGEERTEKLEETKVEFKLFPEAIKDIEG